MTYWLNRYIIDSSRKFGLPVATKISDNGFFSEEAIQKSEAIRREHKQLFFYLAEVNEQAHRYPGLLKVESNNFKQVLRSHCSLGHSQPIKR
jgi:hypothetical protein